MEPPVTDWLRAVLEVTTAESTATMVNQSIPTISWQRRAGVWLGISINPAAISVGGGLAIHLPLRDLFWLIPLGAALLTLLCTMQGLAGRRRGHWRASPR